MSARRKLSRAIVDCFIIIAIACVVNACGSSSNHPPQAASYGTLNWLTRRYGTVEVPGSAAFFSHVLRRLEKAVPSVSGQQHRDAAWRVIILDSDLCNAFSLDAGIIVITRGLMIQLSSEAQLASVLSHEMAHQLLGHSGQAYENRDRSDPNPGFYFTLEQELAADRFGMELLYFARYDTSQAAVALAIPYRSLGNKVSAVDRSGLQLRIATLHGSQVGRHQQFGTTDTRAFHKLHQTLRAFSKASD